MGKLIIALTVCAGLGVAGVAGALAARCMIMDEGRVLSVTGLKIRDGSGREVAYFGVDTDGAVGLTLGGGQSQLRFRVTDESASSAAVVQLQMLDCEGQPVLELNTVGRARYGSETGIRLYRSGSPDCVAELETGGMVSSNGPIFSLRNGPDTVVTLGSGPESSFPFLGLTCPKSTEGASGVDDEPGRSWFWLQASETGGMRATLGSAGGNRISASCDADGALFRIVDKNSGKRVELP